MLLLRLIVLLAALALAVPAAAHAADPAHDPPSTPLPLGLDSSQFWAAGTFNGDETASFALELAGGARRLRVAYDTPSREDGFTLEVIDPAGAVRASRAGSNVFNGEAFFTAAAGQTVPGGTWTVRITGNNVTQASVRLRALLESSIPKPAPNADGTPRALLPNLKSVPPYEFGFVAPANPLNGAYPPDTVNPPLSIAGQEPLSCAVDESAPVEAGGAGAKICLRLTTGPINVGEGPFVKTFHFQQELIDGEADPQTLRGKALQVIFHSDGTTKTVASGTYSYHATHAHFHDDGILTYELFRVKGLELVPAGQGTKSGFCPADQLFGEWRRFSQQPRGFFGEGDSPTGSCNSTENGRLALTSGWGDVYRWQRPGQYVEFDGNGDGYYVVRTTVDKSNNTLETDDADNAGYALIRIRGRQVELVERGQGQSHLDPAKVVFTGLGPAGQDPFGASPAETIEPGSTPAGAVTAGSPAATAPSAAPPATGGSSSGPGSPAATAKGTSARVRVSAVRKRGRALSFRASRAGTVRLSVFDARGRRIVSRTLRVKRGVNRVRLPRRAVSVVVA